MTETDDKVRMSESGRSGAGCQVSREDTPKIISSIACYSAFLVYGACVASLGAALPQLANATGKSHSAFGIAFTTRGIGYCGGTLLSAWILGHEKIPVTKEFMTCLALAITGIATGIIASSKSFVEILILFFIQGIGFGGIDVMANVCMPELWALRVQPWMQALHALFGVGAIIGPAMVGAIGYHSTFVIVALCSFIPLGGLVALYILSLRKLMIEKKKSEQSLSSLADIEKTDTITTPSDSPTPSDTSSEIGSAPTGIPVPTILKALIVCLYFVYVGIESGFAGWIPTFALDTDVTSSYSKAAYLSSYFWAALTCGRVLAIPLAIVISATDMLRIQLCIISAASIFIVLLADKNYTFTTGSSWFFGFACSSIFPLAMTIVADYGYTMDSHTTTMFMLASTFGESIVPVCIGVLISQFGAKSLVYVTITCSFALCFIYFGMHYVGGVKQQDINKEVSSGTSGTTKGESTDNVMHATAGIELQVMA